MEPGNPGNGAEPDSTANGNPNNNDNDNNNNGKGRSGDGDNDEDNGKGSSGDEDANANNDTGEDNDKSSSAKSITALVVPGDVHETRACTPEQMTETVTTCAKNNAEFLECVRDGVPGISRQCICIGRNDAIQQCKPLLN